MPKYLILIAAAAVILAVVTMVLVVVHRTGERSLPEPTVVPTDRSTGSASPSAAPPTVTQEAPMVAAPAAAPAEPATVATVVPEDAQDEAVALAAHDPEAFIDSLTRKQYSQLYRVVRTRGMAREALEARYGLETDTRLRMLDQQNSGQLALTEGQKSLIGDMKQGFKWQMNRQLVPLWWRLEEVNRQIQEVTRNANTPQQVNAVREAYPELYKEQMDLQRRIEEARQQFDAQWRTHVKTVLTDDQARALDEVRILGFDEEAVARRTEDGHEANSVRPGSQDEK